MPQCNLSNRKQAGMNTQTVNPASPRTTKTHICPWWLAYTFDNPLRRMLHPADKILGPYVTRGMAVLDFGCGFGHFALGMARLTGISGCVVAADIQPKMLDKTMARARKAGLEKIIHPLLCSFGGIGIPFPLDFALACNSLHETPDPGARLSEIYQSIKPGGRFLLMEPCAHLKLEDFTTEVALAAAVGFMEVERPNVFRQMCALLQKPDDRFAL